MRWVRPMPSGDMYQYVSGRSGTGGPLYFEEVLAPHLAFREHTATLVGDVIVVIGADAERGRLGTHLFHVPSLTWHTPLFEGLASQAPKVILGHASALLPGRRAIAVYGGVIPAEILPGARSKSTRLSRELRVMQLRMPTLDDDKPETTCWPQPHGWVLREATTGDAFSENHVPRCLHTLTALTQQYQWPDGQSTEGALLLFGGQDHTGAARNDARLLNPADFQWRDLHPSGNPPSPRAGHTAAFIARDDPSASLAYASSSRSSARVIIFGGRGSLSGFGTSLKPAPMYNDLYVLTLDTSGSGMCSWSSPRIGGPRPSPRSNAVAVALSSGDVLVFGGADDLGATGTSVDREEDRDGKPRLQLAVLPKLAGAASFSEHGHDTISWEWPYQSGDLPDATTALTATEVDGLIYVVALPSPHASGHKARVGCVHVLDAMWAKSHTSFRECLRIRRINEAKVQEAPLALLRPWSAKAASRREAQSNSPRGRASFGSGSDSPRAPFLVVRDGEALKATDATLAEMRASPSEVHRTSPTPTSSSSRSRTPRPMSPLEVCSAIDDGMNVDWLAPFDRRLSSKFTVDFDLDLPPPFLVAQNVENSRERRTNSSAFGSSSPRLPPTPDLSPGPLAYAPTRRDDWLKASSRSSGQAPKPPMSAQCAKAMRETTLRAAYHDPREPSTPGPGAYSPPSRFDCAKRKSEQAAVRGSARVTHGAAMMRHIPNSGGESKGRPCCRSAQQRSAPSTCLVEAVCDDGLVRFSARSPVGCCEPRAEKAGASRRLRTCRPDAFDVDPCASLCLDPSPSDVVTTACCHSFSMEHTRRALSAVNTTSNCTSCGDACASSAHSHSTRDTEQCGVDDAKRDPSIFVGYSRASPIPKDAEVVDRSGTQSQGPRKSHKKVRSASSSVARERETPRREQKTQRERPEDTRARADSPTDKDPAAAWLRGLSSPRWRVRRPAFAAEAATVAAQSNAPNQRWPTPPSTLVCEKQPPPSVRHPSVRYSAPRPPKAAVRNGASPSRSAARSFTSAPRKPTKVPTANFSSRSPRIEPAIVHVHNTTEPSASLAVGEAERARARSLALSMALRKRAIKQGDHARFSTLPIKLFREADRLNAVFSQQSSRVNSKRGSDRPTSLLRDQPLAETHPPLT